MDFVRKTRTKLWSLTYLVSPIPQTSSHYSPTSHHFSSTHLIHHL